RSRYRERTRETHPFGAGGTHDQVGLFLHLEQPPPADVLLDYVVLVHIPEEIVRLPVPPGVVMRLENVPVDTDVDVAIELVAVVQNAPADDDLVNGSVRVSGVNSRYGPLYQERTVLRSLGLALRVDCDLS